MGETSQQIVFGLVAPLLIAAAVIGPATARACREGDRDRLAWRIPVGLAMPVVLAFVVLYGRPREQWQHVLFVPVAGAVVGVVMAFTPRSVWPRGVLFVILGVLATVAVWPVLERESMWWKLGAAAGTLALAAGLEPLAVRRPGVSLPGGLALAAAAVTTIVLISGFMKLAVPLAALVIGLGVCALVALWRCRFSLADGAVAVVTPLLVVSLIVAWLYMVSSGDALPAASFVLPAAAPLALWLGELPLLRRRSPWLAVPVRWALVAAICGVAVALALRPGGEDASDDPVGEMYRDMMGLRSNDGGVGGVRS
jgi:hypothetical protein